MTITRAAAEKRQSDRVRVCITASLAAQEQGDRISILMRDLRDHLEDWKDSPGEAAAWAVVLRCLQEELARADLSARSWAVRADELIAAGPGGGQA